VIVERIREGRACDAQTVVDQIGFYTVYVAAGGRCLAQIHDGRGETIGVLVPLSSTRFVEVTLDFTDTYVVRRYRVIMRGARRGQFVTEFDASNVYCDQLSQTFSKASCWE